jgi:signal transduction histidine kinase
MKLALRLAAYGLAGLTLLIAVTGVLLNIANGTPPDVSGIAVLTFLAFPLMGLLILRRHPSQLIGFVLLGIGVLVYITFASSDYARFALVRHPGSLPLGELVAWISGWDWIPFALLVLLFLPLLFPTGRLLSPRWWIVIAAGLVFAGLAFAGNAFVPGAANSGYPDVLNPYGIKGQQHLFTTLQNLALPFGLVALIGSVTSVVVRYRRGDGVERRQLRWFFFALVLAAVPFIVQGSVPLLVNQTAVALFIPLLPISIAIAVIRYRLYDIDVVINRALVYTVLAAFITAVYVAIVVGIGALLRAGGRPNILLSILATAIVAVAFQPVRARVQRIANRLVYGDRATPYEVMADFADRMAGVLAVDDVLPRMAEAAARGVGGVAARVTLLLPDGSQRVNVLPTSVDIGTFSTQLGVRYKDAVIGEIAVRQRPGEPLTRAEQRLLSDLAAQAGLVLHNVRLASELRAQFERLSVQAGELRASRQRIVAAQENERRRLEEQIRGGVERELESIKQQLADTDRTLDEDAEEVSHRLEELTLATQETLDRLRELARGIFPPILADRGVVSALQARLRKDDRTITVEAASDFEKTRFDPEVESAVYFTVLEALRRATSSSAIRLSQQNGELRFSIDGLTPNGEMLDSQDRIAALGGEFHLREGSVSVSLPNKG